MLNLAKELLAYHNAQVILSSNQMAKLRAVRDANRQRIKDGLREIGFRQPLQFCSQGSYAMRTVIWKEEKNFDIDDGVYFEKEQLCGPRGAEMTPSQARELIRDAVDDGRFAYKPELRTNCVRVWYSEGYHVDMPVYRKIVKNSFWSGTESYFEIASSIWRRADARAVTTWFEAQTARYTGDELQGGQLRRMVRLLKDFAHSRPSWTERTATGFMISVLASSAFKPMTGRDDECLFRLMESISSSLWWSPSIQHPVLRNESVTRSDDGRPRFFREQLKDAIKSLEKLKYSKDRALGLRIWDRVFNTDYFTSNFS